MSEQGAKERSCAGCKDRSGLGLRAKVCEYPIVTYGTGRINVRTLSPSRQVISQVAPPLAVRAHRPTLRAATILYIYQNNHSYSYTHFRGTQSCTYTKTIIHIHIHIYRVTELRSLRSYASYGVTELRGYRKSSISARAYIMSPQSIMLSIYHISYIIYHISYIICYIL